MINLPIQIQKKIGDRYYTIYATVSLSALLQSWKKMGYLNGNTTQELNQLLKSRNWRMKWRVK